RHSDVSSPRSRSALRLASPFQLVLETTRPPTRGTLPGRSLKVPGQPLCTCLGPRTPVGRQRQDPGASPLRFGAAAVAFHLPGSVGPTTSDSSGAYPRGLRTNCLRFAVCPREHPTQDSFPAAILDLTGAGLSPAGRIRKFQRVASLPPSPGLPGATGIHS